MKSLKWEGIGMKNLFPHTSNDNTYSSCWPCPHIMQSRVYAAVRCPSVRLSVPFARCISVRRVCCCGPGGCEISIDCCTAGAAAARGRSTARSSKCGQCHVFSVRRKLNTDLLSEIKRLKFTILSEPYRKSRCVL